MRDSSAQGLIAWKERLAHLSMSGDAAILLLYSVALCVIAGVERFLVGASLDGLVDFNAGEILALCAIYSVVTAKTAEHYALPRRSRGHLSLRAAPAAARVAAFRFLRGWRAGLYFVLRHPRNAPLSQVGLLWLAISFYESFSQLLFKFISADVDSSGGSFRGVARSASRFSDHAGTASVSSRRMDGSSIFWRAAPHSRTSRSQSFCGCRF